VVGLAQEISMTFQNPRVERMIGGAGTGKTHAMLADMTRAREELGLEPEEIAFSTYTCNGREVMARRAAEAWGCSEDRLTVHGNFRTTHSTALRQTGVSKEQLITDNEASAEWIADRIGVDLGAGEDDDGGVMLAPKSRESNDAAYALNAWNLARNRLEKLDDILDEASERGDPVPSAATARAIVEKYEMAKRADDRVDFPDLLGKFAGFSFDVDGFSRRAPEGQTPEGVRMLCLDEAQDASALVDAACRRLAYAPGVERCLLVGDNFQSVFSFGGGSAENFLSWDATQSVMPQSFRCPSPILALGEDCLKQMHHGYWDRQIAPASHDGYVDQAGNEVDAVAAVQPHKSTLILARCRFTLRKYQRELSRRAIPFTMLGQRDSSSRRGFLALWRLANSEAVLGEDLGAAIEMIRKSSVGTGDLLEDGAKAAWKRGDYANWDIIRPFEIAHVGCLPKLIEMIARGHWLEALIDRHQGQAERWLESARHFGPDLATEPQVRLSTIHAAKGAEADTVFLSTESSGRIARNSARFPALHDEECRVAYVAVTRARERLVVVEDAGRNRLILPYDY
jgi:DNA helicase-2/ATP-dependent DNA helicase PcrA